MSINLVLHSSCSCDVKQKYVSHSYCSCTFCKRKIKRRDAFLERTYSSTSLTPVSCDGPKCLWRQLLLLSLFGVIRSLAVVGLNLDPIEFRPVGSWFNGLCSGFNRFFMLNCESPPEVGGHWNTTVPTDKIWISVELWPLGLDCTLNYDTRS